MAPTLNLLRTLVGLCLVLIGLVYLRVKRVQRMHGNVDRFMQRFAVFEQRAQIVEAEAVCFVNSLDKDTTAALYEVRQLINRAREVAHGVENFLSEGSYYGINRANNLVNSSVLNPEAIVGKASKYGNVSWEQRVESLLQNIGRRVAKAAQRATNTGYATGSTPSRTLKRLSDAGILYQDE